MISAPVKEVFLGKDLNRTLWPHSVISSILYSNEPETQLKLVAYAAAEIKAAERELSAINICL